MDKSKRMLIALVLVAGGLTYLIATAVSDSTMFYFTVEEALAKGAEVPPGKSMRINGEVVAGSIHWSPRDLELSFAVGGEEGGRIDAVYYGPRPDNFEAGVPAILEGRFDEQGVFHVDKLMLACPSRFTAEGEEIPGEILTFESVR